MPIVISGLHIHALDQLLDREVVRLKISKLQEEKEGVILYSLKCKVRSTQNYACISSIARLGCMYPPSLAFRMLKKPFGRLCVLQLRATVS